MNEFQILIREQVACWKVQKDVGTLEAIHNPQVMEAAMKQLQETGGGPLTAVCTMQGFFPYKVNCLNPRTISSN
jgi:hypothetical protein